MNIEKIKKNFEGRGFSFKHFATGAEATAYLEGEIRDTSVGIGGSKTVEALGLFEKLGENNNVAWHWRQDADEARARAAVAEVYITSANGLSENGEIVNIDGMGNRIASNLYGHKRLYIVAGENKLRPDLESAYDRARNIAAPLNARRFGKNTPCATGELRCYDCRREERICRGVSILLEPMMGTEKVEIVLIAEELGY